LGVNVVPSVWVYVASASAGRTADVPTVDAAANTSDGRASSSQQQVVDESIVLSGTMPPIAGVAV
jgi:hypothetical protein